MLVAQVAGGDADKSRKTLYRVVKQLTHQHAPPLIRYSRIFAPMLPRIV